jgi:hypothetical protein
MRNIFLSIGILLMVAPVLADPENITTGPYRVSFDMGLPRGYYVITTQDPLETESLAGEKSTEYKIDLNNESSREIISIIITVKEKIERIVPEIMVSFLKMDLEAHLVQNIESATRDIDGVKGAIVSGDYGNYYLTGKIYEATYRPLFDLNHTRVSIYVYKTPWDKGTLQLLKTIHVERLNSSTMS